jgi:hypothetical protein
MPLIWTWPPQSDRSFWDFYYAGKWGHFPLTESDPIVRIPVAGPEPFNTLAVVRGFLPMGIWGQPGPPDGRLYRETFSVRTSFKLAGHSRGAIPAARHSTAAALRYLFLGTDTSFTAALDKLDGRFDEDGWWLLDVGTGLLSDHANGQWLFHFSSFVLCNEPPLDFERNPGQRFAGAIDQPVWPDSP